MLLPISVIICLLVIFSSLLKKIRSKINYNVTRFSDTLLELLMLWQGQSHTTQNVSNAILSRKQRLRNRSFATREN